MSNEQKPSAADMEVALRMVPNATGILQVHLAEIIARVRREARAEAFDFAALRADARCAYDLRDEMFALAAKERAS